MSCWFWNASSMRFWLHNSWCLLLEIWSWQSFRHFALPCFSASIWASNNLRYKSVSKVVCACVCVLGWTSTDESSSCLCLCWRAFSLVLSHFVNNQCYLFIGFPPQDLADDRHRFEFSWATVAVFCLFFSLCCTWWSVGVVSYEMRAFTQFPCIKLSILLMLMCKVVF